MTGCPTCRAYGVKVATGKAEVYGAVQRALRTELPADAARIGAVKARLTETERLADEHFGSCAWEPPVPSGPETWAADDPRHGRTGYAKGCRCDTCREATSTYQRERRVANRSATKRLPRRRSTAAPL